MSNNFYVYIYLNPLKNNQPFYIGKGKNDRMFEHLKEKDSTNKHKFNTIQTIRAITGYNPPIEIYQSGLTNKEACFLEQELIAFYGREVNNTGILTNLSEGGEGGNNVRWTEEKREYYRKMYSGEDNPNYNNKWSDDQKIYRSKLLIEKYKNGYKSPTLGLKRKDLGERNATTKGFIWINDGKNKKQINPLELDKYLNYGWKRGMKT